MTLCMEGDTYMGVTFFGHQNALVIASEGHTGAALRHKPADNQSKMIRLSTKISRGMSVNQHVKI